MVSDHSCANATSTLALFIPFAIFMHFIYIESMSSWFIGELLCATLVLIFICELLAIAQKRVNPLKRWR